MKRIFMAGAFGLLVLVASVFVPTKPTVMKASTKVLADEGGVCSLARAAGNWGFTDNGTVVGVGQRVAVGRFTLDAEGNLINGVATSSLNGAIADETFSGTYMVNFDCTGTINAKIFASGTELFSVTLTLSFDDHMRELRGLFTSAVEPNGTALATVIALDARKQ
jgi:hypothetical protein